MFLNTSRIRSSSSTRVAAFSRTSLNARSASFRALRRWSDLAPWASSSARVASSWALISSSRFCFSTSTCSRSCASSPPTPRRPAVVVDPGHHVGGEVDDLLEVLGGHVEKVPESARHALDVPDVGDGRGQLDVAHPLAPDPCPGDLDATALTDDALEADALVLAAVALPVPRRPEDLLAEQAVLLGLEGAVVDRLRLADLAVLPNADLLGRGTADPQLVEVVAVEHLNLLDRRGLPPGQVDAQLLGGSEHVLVGLPHFDLLTLGREHLDVQAERLHLLDQHLEGLWDAGLGAVLALEDRTSTR